jgi:hypothetical protein
MDATQLHDDWHHYAVGVVNLPQGVLGPRDSALDQLNQFRIAVADSLVEDRHQIA